MNLAFFDNYKIKLIAFIFAVFIWFFVVTENEYEEVIEIPVATVNLPANKVILNDLPPAVKIRVKGTGKDLIALGLGRNARVELDLSGVERSKKFAVEPRNVFLSRPSGAIFTEEVIMPDSILVVLDEFFSRRLPVVSRVVLSPAPGYTAVGEILLSPDSVVVSGPRSVVAQVQEVFTVEQSFGQLQADLKAIVELAPLPSARLTSSSARTDVYLNIQQLVELTVTDVPVRVRNVPRGLRVFARPTTMSLVLEGGGDLLTKISREDVVAYIDYQRVRSSPGKEYPARIIPPPGGVSYRDVQPRKFKLVLERQGK